MSLKLPETELIPKLLFPAFRLKVPVILLSTIAVMIILPEIAVQRLDVPGLVYLN